MGDRALVIFTDGKEVSPTAYLHWGGEAVPEYLKEHKTLMADRKGDVSYSCARFIGICHSKDAQGNLSIGVWGSSPALQEAVLVGNGEFLAGDSHGDAGLIVVDVNSYEWRAYGGYLADKAAA